MGQTDGQRLGAQIREVRLARRMTQAQLGESADISAGYVAQVEAGTALPSIPAVRRMATALAIPVSSLMAALDDTPDDGTEHLRQQLSALLAGCDEAKLRLALRLLTALIGASDTAPQ